MLIWGPIVCRGLSPPELYLNLVFFMQFRSSDRQSFRHRFKPNHCYSKGSIHDDQLRASFQDGSETFHSYRSCRYAYLLSNEVITDPVVVVDPGGRKSGSDTPFSVSDTVGMERTSC